MAAEYPRYSVEERTRSLRGLLSETPGFAAMLLLVGALLALAAQEAGFAPASWYPVALLALALLLVMLLFVGSPPQLPRAVVLALGLLAAYTAWTYLSITWAERQGPALEGANRTLLYLLLFAVFASWPVSPGGGRILLAVLGFGTAVLGLVEIVRVHLDTAPVTYFLDGRLVEPAGYVNANVAIWTIGLLACLSLAAARDLPVLVRAAALGASGLLTGLALLGQSRGWLLALPLAVVAFIAAAPSRLRALCAVLAVAGATAAVSGRLLAVRDEFAVTRLDDLVADALAGMVTSAVVLTLLGAAAALIDRRRPADPERRRRPVGRPFTAIVGAIGLAALLGALLLAGAPGRVSDAWDDFKQGGQPEAENSRFSSVGTYRYDFWRVAWELFEEEPVKGIGVENFQEDYLERAKSFEQPRYAHSLELGVLSQTGLVGGVLLFGAIACALVAALARLRRAPSASAWLSAGALAIFAYWLLHASVDWLWEFPAVGGAAFAALGLACAPAAEPGRAAARAPRRAAGVAALPAAAMLAVVLGAPWLSERETRRAIDSWEAAPASAFQRLDRAADLNPLSTRPHVVTGAIAIELGDFERARSAFRDALAVEPDNAYAQLELGAIAAERGERRRALALLRRAVLLRPRDEATRYALDRVRNGQRVTVSAVNARILERARARLQREP